MSAIQHDLSMSPIIEGIWRLGCATLIGLVIGFNRNLAGKQVWRPLLHALASKYRLTRYDARGNGLSDWNVELAQVPSHF
jgi:hypothetical protein